MSTREVLSRYNLIVKKVRKKPATLKEINAYLENESELQGYNFNMSRRTFKRDLDDIWALYKIDIKFDFSRKVYYIDADDQQDLSNRMLDAFDTFNSLNMENGFAKYVHFESRKPQGTEHFYGLLHAIKNNLFITFTYHKFWHDRPSVRNVAPYALKEFKGRWYVIAKDEKDQRIKTFGLDRIQDLEITKKRFMPDNFDTAELFKNCFGIINPVGAKAQEIILSFEPEQGKYVKSFPLHASQKILIDNEKELHISIAVQVTYDLIMELLSYGHRVEVLSPDSLKLDLVKHYKKSLSYYS